MRRRITVIGVLVAAAAAALIGASACGSDSASTYQVRAIFLNAFTIIPGEEVKSAGVPIGTIASLDVQDRKAAVVLDITDENFQDFRQDATCQIRPQSLIGERFIECSLTAKKAPGEPEAPKLKKIEDGPGKGQLLLPETNTVNPIDIDLVNNTLELPYRERLTIILNEFGVGLAGNGKALRKAVRQANPALAATEKVIGIFAEQNKVLAQIAEDGDRALEPLARERQSVADSIDAMSATASATAERTGPLEEGLRTLPATLREVRPTMAALSDLADQMQPVADDLKVSGKDLSRVVIGLGELGEQGTPAFEELADTLEIGRDALLASEPLLQDAKVFAKDAIPIGKNLGDLLASLDSSDGIEHLMSLLFFTAASTNGFDEDGHYQRTQSLVNLCTAYVDEPAGGECRSNFAEPEAAAATTAGDDVQPINVSGSTASASRGAGATPVALPKALLPGSASKRADRRPRLPAGADRGATEPSDGKAAVLDYLLGD